MKPTVLAAVFAVSFILVNPLPSFAAGKSSGHQAAAPNEAGQPQDTQGRKYMTPQERAQHTEERIKELHNQLGITGAQEARWAEVAKTMRDNEATLSSMIEQRHKDAVSMNALDDLQSYADITQAHADGIKRMMTAFEPLYDDMTENQRNNADTVFNSLRGKRSSQVKSGK